MIRLLVAFLRPLPEIVKELRILRELYELELGARAPPIYRITEKPSKRDTEIIEAVDDRPAWKRWYGADDMDEEETLA